MPRSLVRTVHLVASLAALTIIALFLVATIASEMLGDEGQVASVKASIAGAVGILVPTLAVAGLSGKRLAGASRSPMVLRKKRRMAAVAATGVLVLVPCAVILDRLAAEHSFGLTFGVLQAVELVGGASNVTLLALNFRDGMALRGQRRATGRRRRAVGASA
jgi:hypothetical protein